jgi:hypothetical protein
MDVGGERTQTRPRRQQPTLTSIEHDVKVDEALYAKPAGC